MDNTQNTDSKAQNVIEGEILTPSDTIEQATSVPNESTPQVQQAQPETQQDNLPETPKNEEVTSDVLKNEEIKPEENGVSKEVNSDTVGSFTIRSDETGDKVYMVREKKRYWIKNPETLTKLGFYLGKERRISFSELLQYPEGEPIDMTIPNAIMPWDKPEQEKVSIANNPSAIWN